jgi:hypothetical protein
MNLSESISQGLLGSFTGRYQTLAGLVKPDDPPNPARLPRLRAIYAALQQMAAFGLPPQGFESTFKNRDWLLRNLHGLTAAAIGAEPNAGYAPLQADYLVLWRRFFENSNTFRQSFDGSRCAIQVVSIRPAAVFELRVYSERLEDPHDPSQIAPHPLAALMKLESDLVNAIERQARAARTTGFRLLWDLWISNQAKAPGHTNLCLADSTLQGASLEAAAAVAFRLACLDLTTDGQTVIMAHVDADGQTLHGVGGEREKIKAALRKNPTRIVLAADHNSGLSRTEIEQDPAFAGIRFHFCHTVDEAEQVARHFDLPVTHCPLDDHGYQRDEFDEEAAEFLQQENTRAVAVYGPGGTGKSSLFWRSVAQASRNGQVVLDFDFANQNTDIYQTLLSAFAPALEAMGLVENWSGTTGSKNFDLLLDTALRHPSAPTILLALDGCERLRVVPDGEGNSFLKHLRLLHESANTGTNAQAHRKRLRFLLVTGIDPLFLEVKGDKESSPFNVARRVDLSWSRWDPDRQMARVNYLYGSPLKEDEYELSDLYAYVGGNPRLVRTCLYEMAKLPGRPGEPLRQFWFKLMKPHVERLSRRLHANSDLDTDFYPRLRQSLRRILDGKTVPYIDAGLLERLGLVNKGNEVQGEARSATITCDLYREYFSIALK